MLNVTVRGDKELVQRFKGMSTDVHAALLAVVYKDALKLQAHVQLDKLSGQVLKIVSGDLKASITHAVDDNGSSVYGRVFSSGDVKYAAIHEFGGVIHHPGGTAYIPGLGGAFDGTAAFISNDAAGSFTWNGGELPRTAAHDINMPERSYIRSSLADMAAQITTDLQKAVVNACRGKAA
jgi:phage gpG-like protein